MLQGLPLPALRTLLLPDDRIRHQPPPFALFEAGAREAIKFGEFLPEKTYSAPWIEHPAFRKAIFDFLDQERNALGKSASRNLKQSLPGRKLIGLNRSTLFSNFFQIFKENKIFMPFSKLKSTINGRR